MLLADKNIVVTGAEGGIGQAMVRMFVQNGASVWACARAPKEDSDIIFADLEQTFPNKITRLYADLTDENQVKQMVLAIKKSGQPVHGLVNNAGCVSPNALFTMTSMQDIRRVFEVNFFSALTLTQLLLRLMIKNTDCERSIVNITSAATTDCQLGQMEYICSKSALAGLTRKLALELKPYNIRVNAIAPSLTNTKMIAECHSTLKDKFITNSIHHRIGNPEDVASIVMFLLSDLSTNINGQEIRADA